MSEHFLESDVVLLKRKLDQAEQVILVSLPILRQACKCSYDWHEQDEAEARFLREDNTINYCLVYHEAKGLIELE